MSLILYHERCKCKEKAAVRKEKKLKDQELVDRHERKSKVKRPIKTESERKPLVYPELNEITSKTFQIRYEKKLSSMAKLIFSSFENKYFYYAIDDILDLLKTNPIERDNLLAILYSPIISLQNNLSINFFDIWIQEIYINETPKINKFLTNDSKIFEQFSYITIKLFYKTRLPIKKQEPLW
jgi:hypothetical protein